ncbi:hypothetical protein BLNAU_19116 [Blattamonas nauphoetae]|uniref:Uncharacterized protein n=1 Tax=Blattamonas nauphoetae TaxID=2049346 RepID=A0ABQ9X4W6_9EUKA|nr:hypothetical protein BLNAU_19116 [Blattamonas nauphoetae]
MAVVALRVTRHGKRVEVALSTRRSPSRFPLHPHAACSATRSDAQTATGEVSVEMVVVKRGSYVKLDNHTSTEIRLVLPEPVNFGRCVSSFKDKSTQLEFGGDRKKCR